MTTPVRFAFLLLIGLMLVGVLALHSRNSATQQQVQATGESR